MNLRNRLIWIAALSVAFAGVQLVASRRNAERELGEYVKSKLMPFANACVREPGLRGALTLQVRVVPDGKLDALVERLELDASSELQDRELVECLRQRTKTLILKLPLPRGPEQLTLTFPIEPPASE